MSALPLVRFRLQLAEPGTAAAVIAVALACEVADRAEHRHDPRQLEMFDESEDE